MRLITKVWIDDIERHLIHYTINLKLNEVGLATLEVETKIQPRPKSLVVFKAGYTVGSMWTYFIGFVDQVDPESTHHWTVKCKEISHALASDCLIALRSCTLADVKGEMQGCTGLKFVIKQGHLTATRFFSHGEGYFCIRRLDRVFGIDDYTWWQRRDGSVWFGTWALSDYALAGNLDLDPEYYIKQKPGVVVVPVIPSMRPGMLVNQHRLTAVRFESNHHMTFRWNEKNTMVRNEITPGNAY